jgi:tRNA nucleotidyltransferase/poly(A) polymerase
MRLKQFITESEDKEIKQRWDKYVKSDPMIKNAVDILEKINSKGYDAYIVGGAVRDLILGDKPHDIDISTNMPIDELDKMFKTYDIGKSKDFGIVVVNQGGYQYEIAQFRSESDYSDGRHPDKIQIVRDFKTDASRRDLTINAMAIDKDGNIIDHFNGKKAITDKIIKTVGNPYDRFEEDKLRMMRACRFSSKYCFVLDPETKDAIKSKKEGIKDIAIERIKDELIKMASQSGDKFANAILTLDEVGILDIILPELTKLKDFQETLHFHPEAYEDGGKGTPFDHTIKALRRNKVADPIINLGVLLHDVGKGVTHRLRSDGIRHSYFQHDKKGAEIIKDIAKKLKLTNKERDAIMFATINHMKLFKGGDMKPSKIVKLVNDENWEVLKQVSYCDDSCRTGLFDKRTFDATIKNMEKIAKQWGDKMSQKKIKIIDGNRVMKLTGLKPGKEVGQIIKKVTDEVINKGIKDQKQIDDLIIKVYTDLS